MTLNRCFNSWGAFFLSALVIYVLVFLAAINVPIHSDDYSYFLQGTSIESRINHYFSWSGRLITDFTSSYLLRFNYSTYTAINSLVLVVLLATITLLPSVILDVDYKARKSTLILWLLFTTYWIANPNLGQTSFWIVGSANYIWPLMWAGFYLLFIFYLLENEGKYNLVNAVILLLLGVFAGLSNESTGISMVFMTAMLLLLYRKNRLIIVSGLAGTLGGFLILYLSPGNFARLSHPAFAKWNEKSLWLKVYEHLVYRIPTAISRYWFALFLVLVLVGIILRYKRKWINKFPAKEVLLPRMFIGLSMFSILVFVHSPSMPRRALNTALYFSLISASFLAWVVLSRLGNSGRNSVVALIGLCALLFVPSYTLFYTSMANAKVQHEIREDIILRAKMEGTDIVEIPDWYFTRLFKGSDKFDTFRSDDMSHYYGVKNIVWTPAYFNYAILKMNAPLKIHKSLRHGLILESIYAYDELGGSRDGLVLQFNGPLDEYLEGGGEVSVRIYRKNTSEFASARIPTDKLTKVGDGYYYKVPLSGIALDDIQKVELGELDITTP